MLPAFTRRLCDIVDGPASAAFKLDMRQFRALVCRALVCPRKQLTQRALAFTNTQKTFSFKAASTRGSAIFAKKQLLHVSATSLNRDCVDPLPERFKDQSPTILVESKAQNKNDSSTRGRMPSPCEVDQWILEMREEGHTFRAIARTFPFELPFHVSLPWIMSRYKHIKNMRGKSLGPHWSIQPRPFQPRWTQEEVEMLQRDLRDGLTTSEIYERFREAGTHRTLIALKRRRTELSPRTSLGAESGKTRLKHGRACWTETEDAIIVQENERGATVHGIHQKLQHRTLNAVRLRRAKLCKEIWVPYNRTPAVKIEVNRRRTKWSQTELVILKDGLANDQPWEEMARGLPRRTLKGIKKKMYWLDWTRQKAKSPQRGRVRGLSAAQEQHPDVPISDRS